MVRPLVRVRSAVVVAAVAALVAAAAAALHPRLRVVRAAVVRRAPATAAAAAAAARLPLRPRAELGLHLLVLRLELDEKHHVRAALVVQLDVRLGGDRPHLREGRGGPAALSGPPPSVPPRRAAGQAWPPRRTGILSCCIFASKAA